MPLNISLFQEWPFKMRLIGCNETSVNNFQNMLRNILEELMPLSVPAVELVMCREIIAVCSQIHTKHINTLCG
jgi:hypothetical protein